MVVLGGGGVRGEGVGGMSEAPTVNARFDGSVLVDGQIGERLRHELVARPVGALLASGENGRKNDNVEILINAICNRNIR